MPGAEQPDSSDPRAYLCVDEFMTSLVEARALSSAFECGLIDHLLQHGPGTLRELSAKLGVDEPGLRFLLDVLVVNRVIEPRSSGIRLSRPFLAALRYRDLLEAKLELAHLVAHDVLDHFTDLVAEPERFMSTARLFHLFDYGRCFVRTTESEELTRRWVRITTALTRYEAQACLQVHDFGRYARMLDVGGNSGEFARQVCRRHPGVRAAVLDLPVVCDVGEQHLRGHPESDRITFLSGDALHDPLPAGFDLISFKSMLHDWPEHDMRRILGRAVQALEPGGTVLIFERGPVRIDAATIRYASLPTLLFQRYFRQSSVYHAVLEAAGLEEITVRAVELEAPFFLVTARKASG